MYAMPCGGGPFSDTMLLFPNHHAAVGPPSATRTSRRYSRLARAASIRLLEQSRLRLTLAEARTMVKKTDNRPDQSPNVWGVEEANAGELQAYVVDRLTPLQGDVPTEPGWFKSAVEASWPRTLVEADAGL